MDVVGTFGQVVEQTSAHNPAGGQRLLRMGWQAMGLKYRFKGDKRLAPADRYLASMMMQAMLAPLQHPQQSAAVSIFTPCELLEEVGLSPYNVEGFSCYLAGSRAERGCIDEAQGWGLPDTLCSYHKTFIGAARTGLLPHPRCIVYTNLVCDANLLTFKMLAKLFDVPIFLIDVPTAQTQDSIAFVEQQLRDLALFLEDLTGKCIDEEKLAIRVARSRRTLEKYETYQALISDRSVSSDLVTPFYSALSNNILLGTAEQERYVSMLLEDVKSFPVKRGKHIYWIHSIPFRSTAVRQALWFNPAARIVGCDLALACSPNFDPSRPYEAMARRMVTNSLNGSALRRIEAGIKAAQRVGADGVVWFNHWGCKHTSGAAQLAARSFEQAGIPFLALDGDGVDSSHGGEGQISTRLGAFLEMLDRS